MTRLSAIMLAALLLIPVAGTGFAQSVYACTDLDSGQSQQMIEGDGGVFYRVDPDMNLHQPFSDETVDQIALLSQALAARGTTLFYIPLPTKSLAMPDQLPQRATDYGFDPAMATTLYVEALGRLREKGVQTADVRRAMRVAADQPPSFFATDYRITALGAKREAKAIADAMAQSASFADLPKNKFESRSAGPVTLQSTMRSALQRRCLIELPQVTTETFTTTRVSAGPAVANNAVFGNRGDGARVTIVGTENDGDATANLAGFLSEFSGLDVAQYAVSGGGSFAAISSYLTSREFRDAPPTYLIWTNPVENNLAAVGDQPMRELITAAADNCRVALPLAAASTPNSVAADLSGLDPGQSYTLMVESEGSNATSARFDFRAADGLIRSKSIYRNPAQVKTGRFYMPMSGLWPTGVQSVDIQLDVPFGATARVTACFD